MAKNKPIAWAMEETVGFPILNPGSTPVIVLPAKALPVFMEVLKERVPSLEQEAMTEETRGGPNDGSVKVYLPKKHGEPEVEMQSIYDEVLAEAKKRYAYAPRKWHLMASVPRSSGEVENATFEGTREEAEQELWNLLEVLGVETSVTGAEDSDSD